jgi:hypothetical protein
MDGRLRFGTTLAALGTVAVLVAGCPLKFEKEARDNSPPFTYFDVSPNDTTFSNEVFFSWIGTDLDSDVVAYQYQLVATDSAYYYTGGAGGRVVASLDPRPQDVGSPRQPGDPGYTEDDRTFERYSEQSLDNFQSFSDLEDGWYEMRARSIDDSGIPNGAPARFRFYVFFDDIPPSPVVIDPKPGTITPACGRIGSVTSWTFFITASDSSRNAGTPREALEFSYQLRARSAANCTTHLTDSFTEWTRFPSGGNPVEIGTTPPTLYTDLFDANCGWELTLRVRDPAGNVASVPCCISRGTGCAAR